MPGTRSVIRIALLTCALAAPLSAPAAIAKKPATTTSIETVRPPGAAASATVNYFTITGTPLASRINVSGDPSGRLVLVSPEGITAPASPAGICTQDNPAQVSCAPGAITAIKGDLGGGADSFATDPLLALPIGLALPGPDSPLHGGGGRDRLFGGAHGDLLKGGAGPDSIDGGSGDDIIRGGAGPDALNGGAGPDALFGGGGADRLNGGGGANLCVGGPGSDFARSCLQTKGVP